MKECLPKNQANFRVWLNVELRQLKKYLIEKIKMDVDILNNIYKS